MRDLGRLGPVLRNERSAGQLTQLALLLLPLLAISQLSTGCEPEGCLGDEPGCIVPSPCKQVEAPVCADTSLELKVIGPGDVVPGGEAALGAIGDVLIGNSEVVAVIDAIDNVNYFVESGGFILDFGTKSNGEFDNNDSINQLSQGMSVLQDGIIVYDELELIRGDGFVAVQVKGQLGGDAGHRVATRYEVRPCEPGIRIRTEAINAGADDEVWLVSDASYWGGRHNWGLSPVEGVGFDHPPLSLSGLDDGVFRMPYAAAAAMSAPSTSYSFVGCNVEQIAALQAEVVSIMGLEASIVRPGDFLIYERMLFAAKGPGAAPAIDHALEARRKLHGEDWVLLRGRVEVAGDAPLRTSDRGMLVISEGAATDPKELRTVITQVHLDGAGAWSARVPAGRDYLIEAKSFGLTAVEEEVSVGDADVDVGTLTLPASGTVNLSVTRIDLRQRETLVVFQAADDETEDAVTAQMLDIAENDCAPMLGYPYGASPACNYVLVNDTATVDVPPGAYDVFATNGLYATIARTRVEILAGETYNVGLSVAGLDLQPTSTLSSDLHVHGGNSYDSALPDIARVRSFLASGLDVIAVTEHDAIATYDDAAAELNVTSDDLVMMTGVETSGFALWKWNQNVTYPQTIGHWNFWPVEYRPDEPRNGAPQTQFIEPGELFKRMKQAELPDTGIIQLNHPISVLLVGRDFGWMSALGLDYDEALPLYDDGSTGSYFFHRPPGSEFRNSDYDTQEVMNGTSNKRIMQQRFVWHWLMKQGFFRTGVANSDTHTLTDNLIGVPQTLVWAQTSRADFDDVAFNDALKKGRAIGTNGPIIDARIVTPEGSLLRPGIAPITPSEDSELRVTVRSAPWVPVEEIRFIVNGRLTLVVDQQLNNAEDPEGTGPLTNWSSTFRLGDVLPGDGDDAWLVIEAGDPLPLMGDLNCDGLPDTTDNDRDGVVDWRDVDRDGDGRITDTDRDTNNDGSFDDGDIPAPCEAGTGPHFNPTRPPRDRADYPFYVLTHGAYSYAFTNPFVLDRDGDGFETPGL